MRRIELAPIVAIVFVCLAVYLVSYLALVVPGGFYVPQQFAFEGLEQRTYRLGDEVAMRVFWPLEQVDRRLRHNLWNPPDVKLGIDFDE